jgi:asparagine synthetase B (glutamine-hydrolysing)
VGSTGEVDAVRRIQIPMSPYAGGADFSALQHYDRDAASFDPVSIADLLRNAFVYPPHSIYRDVKVAISGFDPAQDLYANPVFHFPYQSSEATGRPAKAVDDDLLIRTYHRLLCEAVSRASERMQAPWLLQSGGKDSTSMAIAVAEARPQTTCITYLGGREENEVDSARFVARKLGLRHESLVCDPGRAYDRYLALVPRMPLLTADFAALSYADLATEIAANGGDGILDALGSDPYFGMPAHWRGRLNALLALGVRLPCGVFESRLVERNFKLCYALGTLQMSRFERFYPGSRFSDSEVDALFGRPIATQSARRLEIFREDIKAADSMEARRRLAAMIIEASSCAKGMYTASAMALSLAYPYCDKRLCEWVFHEVPSDRLIGRGGVNKVLVRKHIAWHFRGLPYVRAKGSFRFDLCGLARQRFDQVHAFAQQTQGLLPGAPGWLERHRDRLDNKFFASKFYLLAVVLPWLLSRMEESHLSAEAVTEGRAPA